MSLGAIGVAVVGKATGQGAGKGALLGAGTGALAGKGLSSKHKHEKEMAAAEAAQPMPQV
jgi:hypothetical protein